LGRTFKKSVPAATLTLLESKKADLPALLHELRVVAKGDADEIVGKVKPQDVETADYWDDVRAKEPQRPKRAELAKRIAARIVKGEQKIAQQPFEW
jgi:hypothetical protein